MEKLFPAQCISLIIVCLSKKNVCWVVRIKWRHSAVIFLKLSCLPWCCSMGYYSCMGFMAPFFSSTVCNLIMAEVWKDLITFLGQVKDKIGFLLRYGEWEWLNLHFCRLAWYSPWTNFVILSCSNLDSLFKCLFMGIQVYYVKVWLCPYCILP